MLACFAQQQDKVDPAAFLEVDVKQAAKTLSQGFFGFVQRKTLNDIQPQYC